MKPFLVDRLLRWMAENLQRGIELTDCLRASHNLCDAQAKDSATDY